jgi:hypothetical protein
MEDKMRESSTVPNLTSVTCESATSGGYVSVSVTISPVGNLTSLGRSYRMRIKAAVMDHLFSNLVVDENGKLTRTAIGVPEPICQRWPMSSVIEGIPQQLVDLFGKEAVGNSSGEWGMAVGAFTEAATLAARHVTQDATLRGLADL